MDIIAEALKVLRRSKGNLAKRGAGNETIKLKVEERMMHALDADAHVNICTRVAPTCLKSPTRSP
jgi:hypothetical protein